MPAEALGREHPIVAVLHPVHAVPLRVKDHRVDVDLVPRAVAQDEVRVGLATVELVAVAGERLTHRRNVAHADDEVEILVGARLLAEQRVDRPAAVEPRVDPGAVKALEDRRDIVAGHHRDRVVWYGARHVRPARGAHPRRA